MADEHRRWVIPPRTGTFRDSDLDCLDPNDPDERRILIEAEHPEYADPPETWATARRLTDLGYDRHEVIHMLGGAVTTQLWRTLHEQEPFDLAGFLADLDGLPESWEQQRAEAKPRRRTRRPSPWIGGSR